MSSKPKTPSNSKPSVLQHPSSKARTLPKDVSLGKLNLHPLRSLLNTSRRPSHNEPTRLVNPSSTRTNYLQMAQGLLVKPSEDSSLEFLEVDLNKSPDSAKFSPHAADWLEKELEAQIKNENIEVVILNAKCESLSLLRDYLHSCAGEDSRIKDLLYSERQRDMTNVTNAYPPNGVLIAEPGCVFFATPSAVGKPDSYLFFTEQHKASVKRPLGGFYYFRDDAYDLRLVHPQERLESYETFSQMASTTIKIMGYPVFVINRLAKLYTRKIQHELLDIVNTARRLDQQILARDHDESESLRLENAIRSCAARLRRVPLVDSLAFAEKVDEWIAREHEKRQSGLWIPKIKDIITFDPTEFRYYQDVLRDHLEGFQQARLERMTQSSLDIARNSLRVAQEAKKDSRAMKAIAFITMFFLPATFVSSFFGMNFFSLSDSKQFHAGNLVWIFFLIAFILTGVVVGPYFLNEYREKRKEAQASLASTRREG